MVEIPDSLECLFTTSLEEQDGSYTIEVPRTELEKGSLTAGETYRVVLLEGPESPTSSTSTQSQPDEQAPPVESGDIREVTIESLGDQGDGIAKVERGYVVIVPGARPGDEVTVEIRETRENVAFADIQEPDSMSEDGMSLESGETIADEAPDDDD
ncbi:TRAM domain-containing protein [Halococcus salsus]|uniref:TRAM domain-containing protein n=1 Tax=Halococcus salsus TaxID=2162894 RepID=UPI0013596DEA|nr:TRAM domain-containing protein [Halococcus salsus]